MHTVSYWVSLAILCHTVSISSVELKLAEFVDSEFSQSPEAIQELRETKTEGWPAGGEDQN